jgi:hypothetical protein
MRNHGKVWSAALTTALIGAMSALAVTSAEAQDLTGRWRIELRTGVGVRLNSGTSTSGTGVETTTEAAGFLGALGCSRWFSEDLAGTLSLGVLSGSVKTRAGVGGVETTSAVVIPFFIGVRRYLSKSDPQSSTRLFGSLEAGPVTGYQSSSRVGSVISAEAISRSAFGGRVGAGVEFGLGSRAMLGLVGGFAFMTDFSDAIGGEKNHSGPDLGLSFGILLGG